jgi:hypothetical protein
VVSVGITGFFDGGGGIMHSKIRKEFRGLRGITGAVAITVGVVSLVSLSTGSIASASGVSHVAGYVAPTSAGPTQSDQTTFVVPKISCTGVKSKGFQAVVLGASLEVTIGNTGGGVVLICAPTPSYLAFFQENGSSVSTDITVHPGNTITVSNSESSSASSVTVTDGSQTQTATGGGGTVTGETVGALAVNCVSNGKCSPVPRMQSVVHFTTSSINGSSLSAAGAVQSQLVDVAGKTEVKSSALKSGGRAFNDTWVFSCGSSAVRC